MKFKCKNCGACCRDFGKHKNLPLFEWEAEDLRKIAKERGIELNIKPTKDNIHLDKKSGEMFSLLYGMFNVPCPFHIDNKCSIYEQRPLICRQFPLHHTPLASKDQPYGADAFLMCQNFDSELDFNNHFKETKEVKKEEIIDYLKETYGDCYDYTLQSENATQFLRWFIQGLIKEKQINSKEINNKPFKEENVLPFFDFCLKHRFIDKKTKEDTIKLLRDKNKLKEFIEDIEKSE